MAILPLSLKNALSGGLGAVNDANRWTLATTWQALGVPAGARVTAVTGASMQSRLIIASDLTATHGPVTLADGATSIVLSAARVIASSEGAFVTSNGVNITGLNLPASDAVKITINDTLRKSLLGGGAQLNQDQLTFTITYVLQALTLDSGSYTLTGRSIALSKKTRLLLGAYGLVGEAAQLVPPVRDDYVLQAVTGLYNLAGQVVAFSEPHPLSVDPGSYTLTGLIATLTRSTTQNRVMQAVTGIYNLTGEPVLFDRTLTLDAGIYALVGEAAQIIAVRSVIEDTGFYNLVGEPVIFTFPRTMDAAVGSYVLTGLMNVLTASTTQNRVMQAVTGLYNLIGEAANLAQPHAPVDAGVGSYDVTGLDAILTVSTTQNRIMQAVTGLYTIGGQAGDLVAFRLPLLLDAGFYNLTGEDAVFTVSEGAQTNLLQIILEIIAALPPIPHGRFPIRTTSRLFRSRRKLSQSSTRLHR